MEDSSSSREKRRQPRFQLSLPIEFRVTNDRYVHGAMIVNASETGLLVQSPNNLPVGTKLNIAVLFSKGFELANFEVVAEVVWTKNHPNEGREGYQFGLRFVHILEEDRQKLKHLLGEAY
jgi:PilZ domain